MPMRMAQAGRNPMQHSYHGLIYARFEQQQNGPTEGMQSSAAACLIWLDLRTCRLHKGPKDLLWAPKTCQVGGPQRVFCPPLPGVMHPASAQPPRSSLYNPLAVLQAP